MPRCASNALSMLRTVCFGPISTEVSTCIASTSPLGDASMRTLTTPGNVPSNSSARAMWIAGGRLDPPPAPDADWKTDTVTFFRGWKCKRANIRGLLSTFAQHQARRGARMARRKSQQYQRYCENFQRRNPGCPERRLHDELRQPSTSSGQGCESAPAVIRGASWAAP